MEPTRVDVWMALADQFLDTETRPGIPLAALTCLQAGLSMKESRAIWRYEVAPAVWTNVWSVAGEWGGWRRDGLVQEIERRRGRWPNRPGMLTHLVYRLRVHLVHECWRAIERCMRILADLSQDRRRALASDLTLLAREYFEMTAIETPRPSPSRVLELRRIYVETFLPIFEPLVVEREGRQCAKRVVDWLAP